jgi:hypothetical protein
VTLSREDYIAAAWLLRCEPEAIQAVAEVESGPLGGFLPTGEPVILFERHKFYQHTLTTVPKGARMPTVVGSLVIKPENTILSWPTPGGYGPVSIQHAKLEHAAKLDRDAALKSCSWGRFQILGENHRQAGFPILQRFVNAMYRSEQDHLRAFVMFIRADHRLVDALRTLNFPVFAAIYNGPAFKKNAYDRKMRDVYVRLAGTTPMVVNG